MKRKGRWFSKYWYEMIKVHAMCIHEIWRKKIWGNSLKSYTTSRKKIVIQKAWLGQSLADPRGHQWREPPPPVQILSFSWSFSAKSLQNYPTLGVGAPSSGKSWIRHCHWSICGIWFDIVCRDKIDTSQLILLTFEMVLLPFSRSVS